MPRFPGFVGPTYTTQSPWVDAERCVNLIPCVADSGTPKERTWFEPVPGLSLFCDVAGVLDITGTMRGEIQINGRCFVVCGARFVELSASHAVLGNYGDIIDDGHPVSLSSSQRQIFIVSGEVGYSFDLATNVLAPVMVTDVVAALTIAASPNGLSIRRDQPQIISISQIGTIVTVTLPTLVPFRVGQNATISGVTPAGFNGTFPVLSVVGNTFTYSTTAGLVGWATGTASKGSTQNVPILSLTSVGNIVTITTTSPLDTEAPQEVTISGCSVAGQNGTWTLDAAPIANVCKRSSLVETTLDYRPTTNTGSDAGYVYDNAANAYDVANGTTFASASVSGEPDTINSRSVVYAGFDAGVASSGTLSVYSSASGSGTHRSAILSYNLGSGLVVYFYALGGSGASRGAIVDSVALPAGQQLSDIEVTAQCTAGPDDGTETHRIYDIKVTATVALGIAPPDVSGGVATAYTLVVMLEPTTAAIPSVGQAFTLAGASLSDYDGDYVIRGTSLVNTAGVENWYLYCDSAVAAYGRAASGGGTVTIFGDVQLPAAMGIYCDGYFIRLHSNHLQLGISAPNDCTSWDLTDVIGIQEFPDKIVSIISDHLEVWIQGHSKSVVKTLTGSDNIFDTVPGSYIEQGAASPAGSCRADNSIFWIGEDERGGRIAWRANGYRPTCISTRAVEYRWGQYSTISDVFAWSYQENGHTFVVFQFPTASATWVYDAATGLWHERGYWNGFGYEAHLAMSHIYVFDKHLVGDRLSGKVFELSSNNTSDNGTAIRWERDFPYVANDRQWVFHNNFQLDAAPGLAVGATEPTASLRWSDDGGHNYSTPHSLSLGTAGEYSKRLIARRLGRSRGRIYEVSGATPVQIVSAYLNEP